MAALFRPSRRANQRTAADLASAGALLIEAGRLADDRRFASAEARFAEALAKLGDEPGEEFTRLRLRIRTARARALLAAGDYTQAGAHLRQAIMDAEVQLGRHDRDLVVPLNELGMVGKYSGSFADAETYYRRALSIDQFHAGKRTETAAAILHNLAGLAHARGNPAEAEPLAQLGIDVRAGLPDPDPMALAADRAALAAILIDLGRNDAARELLTEVLASYEEILGPDHHEVAVTLHNLGSLDYREGNFRDGATALDRARAIKLDRLGPRHPDLAITLHNLACCLQRLGDTDGARRHLEAAVAALDGSVADDHPTLVACRRRLDAL